MAKQDTRTIARQVMQLRHWQHLVNEGLKQNLFPVPVHCAFGHEAIAVAVSEMLQAGDRLVLSHRNIAYNLARAGALRPVYDEYLNRPQGASGGRLGSMNLSQPKRGLVYTSSILGNNMPVACGLALGMQLQGQDGLVAVLTGDGAMEEGTLYESFTISCSQHLRVLFVIENNKYAMSSTIPERRCPIAVGHLCKAVGMPYAPLRGNNVFDYLKRLNTLRRRMVRQPGPACVEVDLLNLNRHAGPTPGWPTDPMNIDLGRGLQVAEDAYDPLVVLRQCLPDGLFAELEKEVLAETWSA